MSVKRAAWRAQSIAQAFYKRRFIPTQKPSRTGNTSLRAALYMPSLVARRHNPILYRLAERWSATGMAKKAVIGAIMHKLAHLIYGVIHNDKPFDAHYLEKGLAIQDGI